MSLAEAGPLFDEGGDDQDALSIPLPVNPDTGAEGGVTADVIGINEAPSAQTGRVDETAQRLATWSLLERWIPGEEVTGFVGPNPKNGRFDEPMVWDHKLGKRVSRSSQR